MAFRINLRSPFVYTFQNTRVLNSLSSFDIIFFYYCSIFYSYAHWYSLCQSIFHKERSHGCMKMQAKLVLLILLHYVMHKNLAGSWAHESIFMETWNSFVCNCLLVVLPDGIQYCCQIDNFQIHRFWMEPYKYIIDNFVMMEVC